VLNHSRATSPSSGGGPDGGAADLMGTETVARARPLCSPMVSRSEAAGTSAAAEVPPWRVRSCLPRSAELKMDNGDKKVEQHRKMLDIDDVIGHVEQELAMLDAMPGDMASGVESYSSDPSGPSLRGQARRPPDEEVKAMFDKQGGGLFPGAATVPRTSEGRTH
jgi:hypothetical protein